MLRAVTGRVTSGVSAPAEKSLIESNATGSRHDPQRHVKLSAAAAGVVTSQSSEPQPRQISNVKCNKKCLKFVAASWLCD